MSDPSLALASETEKVCAITYADPIKNHMTNKNNVDFMNVEFFIIGSLGYLKMYDLGKQNSFSSIKL